MISGSGRSVGIAHAEVDHVDAGNAFLVLQLVDLAEQIRRQAASPLGHGIVKGSVFKRELRVRCACVKAYVWCERDISIADFGLRNSD